MVPNDSFGGRSREPIRRLYRLSFVKNSHRLLALAHQRLDASSLRSQQEPAITGMLVDRVKALVESEHAPRWARHMIALDDPPQASAERLGRARRRVDIEFCLVQRGPRPRLHFEAKRLYRSDSVREYLGPEGLELFVRGEYAAGQHAGGMLGYVQSDSPQQWSERIMQGMAAARERLAICEGTAFEVVALIAELDSVHLTCHDRQSVGRPIHIYHTLLRCC